MTGFRATAALCVGLAATPGAWADIAPAELWAHWQQSGSGSAQATQTQPGGALRLDRPRLRLPLAGGTATLTAETAGLRDDGAGGTVLSLAPGQTLGLQVTTGAGPASASFALGGDGLRLTATGTLPAPDYRLASDEVILTLIDLAGSGRPADLPELRLTLDALDARLTLPPGGAFPDLTATADTLTTSFAIEDRFRAMSVSGTTAQSDLRLAARRLPVADGDGWSGALSLETGPSSARTSQTTPETGRLETRLQADTSRLSVALDPATLVYAAATTGALMAVQADRLPVPEAEIGIAEAEMAMTATLPEGGETGMARLEMHLSDVTAGDALWALLDPGRALPRTAAQLDLVAESELAPVDAAAQLALGLNGGPGLPPVLPQSLTLREFSLRFVDAQVEADGDFTIATSEQTGLPDIARPVGMLDLTVTGGMALLQRLMEGGLISPQAALGAQMMIGMLATPGEGDTLSTTVRTEADGGLVVNGTRLR
jgi:hypothetical protein